MARAQRDLPCALRLPPGECLTLRPITPDNSEVLQAYVRGLSPESRYNRFFGALQELPPAELERVTHLDRRYDLALVAETDVGAVSIVIGEARHAFTPDRLECEFALSVADDWRGRGIGTLLTAEMERRARSHAAITARRVYDRCPSTIIDGVLILLAIVAGFAFAVHVVGFRVINPFDTTWLSGEASHSYLGRAFFRHESAVPLGIVGKGER